MSPQHNHSEENSPGHHWHGGRILKTQEEGVDELLELVWTLREKGVTDTRGLLEQSRDPEARAVLERMIHEGLVAVTGEALRLSEIGEALAEGIIRRHRLTERLLMELFELSEEEAESEACKLEHLLSPAVTDSVCSFLGHPPVCPHGKPIPKGPCCHKLTREVQPLIQPLSTLELGREGKVVFISTRVKGRLEPLSALGIIPGTTVQLKQRRPSYVIQLGETSVALDEHIVREIYVKAV
jgi:DtxR family transcriptional regulator, Mn-dependent transcriptional regulator